MTAALSLTISLAFLGQALAAPTLPPTPPPGLLKSLGIENRPPPTDAEIAAARSEADAILQAARASDLFENVSAGRTPMLRHRASGLVCSFVSGSPINKVLIFREPRGDSIGCNTSRENRSFSIFLDRAPTPPPPVEQLIGLIGRQIPQRFPEAQPSKTVMTTSGKDDAGTDLPPHRVAQYVRTTPQGVTEERVAVGYAGGWLLQQRVTEPEAENTTADLLNELNFVAAQRTIIKAAAAAATGR